MMKTIRNLRIIVKGIRKVLLLLNLLAANTVIVQAQTIYVDPVKGKNEATGSAGDPLMSLEKAVALTHHYNGGQQVHIKLYPGLYIISDKLVIRTGQIKADVVPYIIESVVMPDDLSWTPAQMPVIQSIAGVNDTSGFRHTIGLSIEKSNVSLLGLKFLGNPNSVVPDYYPIRRADKLSSGLTVSQCYFIGEANSAAVQSAFWVSGASVHVDHCIFHSCKIAFVLGAGVNDFSLSYSIIDDAYNTAIWYGFAGNVPVFRFSNNVITNSFYVMVYPAENGQPDFLLRNSYLVNNKNYLGNYPKAQDQFFTEKKTAIKEFNIIKQARVSFVKVKNSGMTRNYLNLSPGSTARSTLAGIFKRKS